MRHVAWFNGAAIEPSPTDGLMSNDQTVRRRCLQPARALEELGLACSVFGNLCDADPAHVSKHLQKLNTDIVVIGRIEGASLLKLARAAKHLGCYVIADFSNGVELSDDTAKLAAIADRVVAADDKVAKAIHKKIGMKPIVIPDCDENNPASAVAVAKMWLACFKELKMAPPACANTNVPQDV